MNGWVERIGSPGRPPVIIAHRGDSFHAPENTLEAARKGFAAGAWAWELDVHRTRDGVPVVIHDESLLRTTDVAEAFAGDPRLEAGALVADFDLDEIRRLDAGSWFVRSPSARRSSWHFGTRASLPEADVRRFDEGRIPVPTLAEALALTTELDWRVNVEIKSFPDLDPGLLPACLREIEESGAADRVLISSFNHLDVVRCRELAPGLPTAILVDQPIIPPRRGDRSAAGANFLHTSAEALGSASRGYRRNPALERLEPGTSIESHEVAMTRDGHRLPVLVYTVNSPLLAEQLASAGVAGIFTDDPSGLAQLVG